MKYGITRGLEFVGGTAAGLVLGRPRIAPLLGEQVLECELGREREHALDLVARATALELDRREHHDHAGLRH